jgi:hypothetical protein
MAMAGGDPDPEKSSPVVDRFIKCAHEVAKSFASGK